MIKKIFVAIAMILLALIIWKYDLAKYGFQQAKGQMKILWAAKPLDHYLNQQDFPDSLKQKLLLVKEVKDFAVNQLGLKGKDNYAKLYDQQGMPVLWVVTAAPPYELKAREWKFPLLGSFSYKGFFNYETALKEKEKLEIDGYDTGIRTVNAWSTLGWFNDPLLSGVLNRGEGDLAELIIHELTHTTLYIKDSVDFNENLATFIGSKGAESFLALKYGVHSPQYRSYISAREDRNKFTAYVLEGADRLSSVYQSLAPGLDEGLKAEKKQAAISEFTARLDSLTFNQADAYADHFAAFNPNNTFFLSYMRYRAKLTDLERQFEAFDNDLISFIAHFKSTYRSL